MLAVGAEGVRTEPRLASPYARGTGPREPAIAAALEDRIDRLERAGAEGEARAMLEAQLAGEDPDPWIAAWALETLAAFDRRAGDRAEAVARLARLQAEHPGARDRRGLLRSAALRYALARGSEDPVGELLAVHAVLVADHTDRAQSATAALKRRIARELAELEPGGAAAARLAEQLAGDRRGALLRGILAAAPRGLGDWLAGAEPGALRLLELEPDPLEEDGGAPVRVLARALGPGPPGAAGPSGPRARVHELTELAAYALAQPEIEAYARLGFATALASADGTVLARCGAGEEPLPGEPLARRPVGDTGLAAEAYGLDLEGFLAQERRRFLTLGLLFAGALGVALVASLATVRAVRREERAAAEREGFVAAVTHELKTPVAAIRLLAEVLERGGVEEPKVRELAGRARGEAERLSRLIAGVLDLARLEQGGAAPRPHEPTDVNALAAEALATFRPVAESRGFTLELRPAPGDPTAPLERDAVLGALLGLLDNALKYSDQPGAIELEVDAAADGVRLAVLDRGRGVPAREARGIFEPFRRVGDELVRDRPGAGLGLALVQRIARAHGGRATCRPREGGGSRFEIALPRGGPKGTGGTE